jgi:DNA-3-methyladenine glycosylase
MSYTSTHKLPEEFYKSNALTLAQGLLGKKLVCVGPGGLTSGYIVETEAYMGAVDRAAHTYEMHRTKRTDVLFGTGGLAYVYLIYGIYYCMNVSANLDNFPEAVLIRALEPVDGIELMKQRRNTEKLQNLCSGPGKLCAALGISKEHNGFNLGGDTLYIEETDNSTAFGKIARSPRVNIDYAGQARDYPWRFYYESNSHVSKRR